MWIIWGKLVAHHLCRPIVQCIYSSKPIFTSRTHCRASLPFDTAMLAFSDPTPERDKLSDPGPVVGAEREQSQHPDMDGKRMRFSQSPVLGPLNQPNLPVRVRTQTYVQSRCYELCMTPKNIVIYFVPF